MAAGSDEFFLDGTDWPDDGAELAVATQPPQPEKPPEQVTVAPAGMVPVRQRRGPEPLYFDLESAPDYSRIDSFGLDPLPPIPEQDDLAKMPPPSKIVDGTVEDARKAMERQLAPPDEWLELVATAERNKDKPRQGVFELLDKARAKRQQIIDLHSDRKNLLSTTPEFCRIVALGWAVGNGSTESLVVGQTQGFGTEQLVSERTILERFWQLATQHSPLIGFNILGFDLPVIFVRSAILRFASSRMFDLKPWGKDVVDVYSLRFPKPGASGDGKPRKLKALCPLYGIEIPAGDVDGSQVEELLEKDPVKLGLYVRSDVEVCRQFHKSLQGYFWP